MTVMPKGAAVVSFHSAPSDQWIWPVLNVATSLRQAATTACVGVIQFPRTTSPASLINPSVFEPFWTRWAARLFPTLTKSVTVTWLGVVVGVNTAVQTAPSDHEIWLAENVATSLFQAAT